VLLASCIDDVPSITTIINLMPQVGCGQVVEVPMVVLATRRVPPSLRSRDLMVASRLWRLLYFLLDIAACGLLSILVVLVALMVVVPLRVGSTS
jgi:hypothetical protein